MVRPGTVDLHVDVTLHSLLLDGRSKKSSEEETQNGSTAGKEKRKKEKKGVDLHILDPFSPPRSGYIMNLRNLISNTRFVGSIACMDIQEKLPRS